MSTHQKSSAVLAWASGLGAGAITATVLISIAYAQGYESFARGMTIGAAIAGIAMVTLWLLGRRAGGAGRLATGDGDERDKMLAMKASSDASVGMLFGALGGTVAGMYGTPGPIVGGIVLWAGLLAWVGSYAWHSRRA